RAAAAERRAPRRTPSGSRLRARARLAAADTRAPFRSVLSPWPTSGGRHGPGTEPARPTRLNRTLTQRQLFLGALGALGGQSSSRQELTSRTTALLGGLGPRRRSESDSEHDPAAATALPWRSWRTWRSIFFRPGS